MPQAVQGSGPPPVVAPTPGTPANPPTGPALPNKTTSQPGQPSVVPTSVGAATSGR
jgi:hypothetical protein